MKNCHELRTGRGCRCRPGGSAQQAAIGISTAHKIGPPNGLTWPEVRDLVTDGAIHNDWVGVGAAIAVLSHEQQALCDFCSDVYGAWKRFQVRTATALPILVRLKLARILQTFQTNGRSNPTPLPQGSFAVPQRKRRIAIETGRSS